MLSKFVDHEQKWNEACDAENIDIWMTYLSGLHGYDLFTFVADFGVLTRIPNHIKEEGADLEEVLPLASWLTYLFSLDGNEREIRVMANDHSLPIKIRLPLATFLVWYKKMQRILRKARNLILDAAEGTFAYYCDQLHCSILVCYKFTENAVALTHGLAIPQPHAYLDPVQAINYASTRSDIDVIKRALAAQNRLVIQRETLVGVKRNEYQGVFGPTIDTLYLNDWLFVNRYSELSQDRHGLVPFADREINFLEVGCGNGLISATFAHYCEENSKLDCVDVDPLAVSCTELNCRAQRKQDAKLVPSNCSYMIMPFCASRHTLKFDLIVSNPPYIPWPEAIQSCPRDSAVYGTELIDSLIDNANVLLNGSGELVMIASELADEEIAAACTRNGFNCQKEFSRCVPFDITGIPQELLSWLMSERPLIQTEKEYYHQVTIYVISREEHNGK